MAIALHNGDPRQDLLEKDIFPIKMIQFPLIALLLYCDAVHEWNRTEASKNQLVDIEFGDSKVKFVVHFDRSTDAEIKAHEFSSIDQCLIEAPLILEFGSSYAVGQRRLNREVMKGG